MFELIAKNQLECVGCGNTLVGAKKLFIGVAEMRRSGLRKSVVWGQKNQFIGVAKTRGSGLRKWVGRG